MSRKVEVVWLENVNDINRLESGDVVRLNMTWPDSGNVDEDYRIFEGKVGEAYGFLDREVGNGEIMSYRFIYGQVHVSDGTLFLDRDESDGEIYNKEQPKYQEKLDLIVNSGIAGGTLI
jgi:hypothetical protein